MRKARSDAAAHRDILLAAADAVFSEQGVTAPLDRVVERAGLGRATLYRNFPNREALMAALLDKKLASLDAQARSLASRDDALFVLFDLFGQSIAESAPLVDFWRAVDRGSETVRMARQRIADIFEAPLRRAIEAGVCRPDLVLPDVLLVSNMLGASLRGGTPAERKALARRAMQIMRLGLDGPHEEDAQG